MTKTEIKNNLCDAPGFEMNAGVENIKSFSFNLLVGEKGRIIII
jgi:hypothetical protein